MDEINTTWVKIMFDILIGGAFSFLGLFLSGLLNRILFADSED